MDTNLNQAVIKATIDTLEALVGMAVESGPPVESKPDGASRETSVIISFVGDIAGAFTLRCSRQFAAKLASQMLGSEVGEDSDDMKDAIGEMFNMIVGSTKSFYAASGDPFRISVPTTIVGEDYTVHIKLDPGAEVALIPFKCAGEDWSIEVFLS